ncbi:hypothetical protein CHS0354_026214 [Potamilus streckersoni]|uniref:Solute carrier family 12 member 2 n=1 Tax=Potamilus streckersoni TaxID=2493646 RepID=A0AAE0SLP4_9BIVA|nr:hypothetical protein CHS0354_026214 [Potamilus streckersoni]
MSAILSELAAPSAEQKTMEKVPSVSRFHVAKVDFTDENIVIQDDSNKNVDNGSVMGDGIDSPSATFSVGFSDGSYDTAAYGTNHKTFGKNTVEAIPHMDHYRNLLSATAALKTRPTLAELHEEKDNYKPMQPLIEHLEKQKDAEDIERGNGEEKIAHKFGWIQGVFIRCLLNIWGVMMFLRLSWVTGQAGIGLGTVIVLLASTVTMVTSLSMSAICTNGIVKGGGVYYMISRSLGPEFGGAIGLIFSLANAVAVAMYVVGFAETVRDLLKAHNAMMVDEINDVRIIGVIAVTVLLIIALIGLHWEARTQVVLLVVLVTALVNFAIGTFIPPSEEEYAKGFVGYRMDVFAENMKPNFREEENFFSVFAVFFPAATGILAGANISGDLKNPSRDIPLGTILSVIVSSSVYMLIMWFLGGCCVREATGRFAFILTSTAGLLNTATPTTFNETTYTVITDGSANKTMMEYSFESIQKCAMAEGGVCKYGLLHDYQVMTMVSGFGPLVIAGIFSATLSSALASLVSAPKVFQAVCKDKIFPKILFFAKGYGASDNPARAYILAYVLGVAFICIGDLNSIAPIISNFFLMSYGLINYSVFDASLAKSPGWRPSFRYYSKWLSLFGALLCMAVMFIINWWTALITYAMVAALLVYVHHSKPDVNWGSSTQAHSYRNALQSTLKLVSIEDHVKNFRPQVLVMTGLPCYRPELVNFVNSLTKKISLMVCGHIIEGDSTATLKDLKRWRKDQMYVWFHKRRIKAFYSVTSAPDFRQGAQSLMQNVGIGKLRPNILMMGFKSTWRTDPPEVVYNYFNVIHDAFDMELGVGIMRMKDGFYHQPHFDEETLDQRESEETNYDAYKDEDSPAVTPSRRDSTPEVEMPPKKVQEQEKPKSDSNSKKTSFSSDPTVKASSNQINEDIALTDMNLVSPINFSKKQKKGTIHVWWMFDDGGKQCLKTMHAVLSY